MNAKSARQLAEDLMGRRVLANTRHVEYVVKYATLRDRLRQLEDDLRTCRTALLGDAPGRNEAQREAWVLENAEYRELHRLVKAAREELAVASAHVARTQAEIEYVRDMAALLPYLDKE
jgi:hypothetical protein